MDNYINMGSSVLVGSLFAGIGGICQGFLGCEEVNGKKYDMVFANEIDSLACKTYKLNFNHLLIEGDIQKILRPDKDDAASTVKRNALLRDRIDVLTAGFPCQPFSIAGDRKGFEDDRGNLFFSIIDTVSLLDAVGSKPRVIFLENVKNLKTHDRGRTYERILSELNKIGYTLKSAIMNTMDFSDIPQNRERLYVVCFLNKQDANSFTLFDRLQHFRRRFSREERVDQIKKIIDYDRQLNSKYYYTKERYPKYFDEYGVINLDAQVIDRYCFYQIRRGMYVRQNKNGVCPTLTANMGIGGHNVPLIRTDSGIRKITPREALRLQGFSDDFNIPEDVADAHIYKQAGNSVSVPIIKLIAKEILRSLNP